MGATGCDHGGRGRGGNEWHAGSLGGQGGSVGLIAGVRPDDDRDAVFGHQFLNGQGGLFRGILVVGNEKPHPAGLAVNDRRAGLVGGMDGKPGRFQGVASGPEALAAKRGHKTQAQFGLFAAKAAGDSQQAKGQGQGGEEGRHEEAAARVLWHGRSSSGKRL